MISSTKHLAVFFPQPDFKVFQIVTCFGIVVLVGRLIVPLINKIYPVPSFRDWSLYN
jgi:hypothetical protein